MMNIENWPLADKEKLFDYLRWNSYLSERYKLLYVSTPKVACTSLKWWFAALEGYDQVLRGFTDSAETDPDLVIHDSFHKVAPNVTGLMPEALSEALTSDSYFRFAVVRNPYKRIFSAWQSKLLLQEPLQIGPYLQYAFFKHQIAVPEDIAVAFEGFLEHLAANEAPSYWDSHWTPQADLLRPDLITYSKLVRIEDAKELSLALADRLGNKIPDPFSSRHANESLIPYLPEFISKRSVQLIRNLYEADFEKFGYSKELPSTKETITTTQFELALKAITLIKGRHQRLNVLNSQVSNLNNQVSNLNSQVTSLVAAQDAILNSTSWKITKPLRQINANLKVGIVPLAKKIFSFVARNVWLMLPISARQKEYFKDKLFTYLPFLFSWSKTYLSWVEANSIGGLSEFDRDDFTNNPFIPLLKSDPPKSVPVKLIAFYLPQFHAIPENNAWWGEGFTEWTNVQPAQPQFEGHYQPHIPDELGYYNLLDPAIQKRQVELAKLYGVGGFCFYFYWFGGKRLLEAPIENYLNDKSLDLPFCLCWANENWSRRWDGRDSEILIAQNHSPEDDLAFIKHVAQYMKDERYIRIDGKPLLLVYRPSLIPAVQETAKCWREWCLQNGIGEIYLAYTQSFETADPVIYGFDAAIEFPPNNSAPPDITKNVKPINKVFGFTIFDWRVFVERSRNYKTPAYKLFRSVCPSWDNTARRKNKGTIFLNNSPHLYQEWLKNAVTDTSTRIVNPDERLVFVNAWNEWAEGAHLEPDQRYGYAYLQATRSALTGETNGNKKNKIIVVSHDAHPHGAQFLALGITRSLKLDLRFDVEVILLGGGQLASEFSALVPIHDLSNTHGDGVSIDILANSLFKRGFTKAIVNTTVSGQIVPSFHKAGIDSLCLIHELPGVIKNFHIENQAKQIAEFAKAVVFPAQMVSDGFAQFAQIAHEKQFIRPQGLYRRNKYRFEKQSARENLRKQLGLNPETKIVLTVGYADHRKGVDLFVECALRILAIRSDVDFVWVGHWEQQMQMEIESRLKHNRAKDRIHFVGFNPDTALFHAASDVYALTSREDPFPNVVLESFDAGIPVVAFAGTGGAADLVKNVGGIVVRPQNIEHFSDAICQLLDNNEESSRLGVAGQLHIDEHLAFRPYLFELCKILNIELPKISVIVPNYNYAQYIEERLASIRRQTLPIYELIILDDASTDKSLRIISSWLSNSNTEARVITNHKNSGNVFEQWRRGVELATGDYVWIAEADDRSEPEFLERVLPPLLSGNVVLSYCASKQINQKGKVLAANYLDYLNIVSPEKWKRPYVGSGAEECRTSLAIMNTIPNVSAVIFKRKSIAQVFKEHFDEIAQFKKAGDWVVYFRILANGNIAFSPRSANLHRRHEGSVIAGGERNKLLEEIAGVQNLISSCYTLPESSTLKAADYLASL